MNIRTIFSISICLICFLAFAGIARADDGSSRSANPYRHHAAPQPSVVPPAEEQPSESAEESESTVVPESYLSDVSTSEGEVAIEIEAIEKGDDAPFFNRYLDDFPQSPVELDKFRYRNWWGENHTFDVALDNSWNSSQHGSAEYNELQKVSVWAFLNNTRFFEMPLGNRARRQDFGVGFESTPLERESFFGSYVYRSAGSAEDPDGKIEKEWATHDYNVGYDFRLNDWDASFAFNHRTLEAHETGHTDRAYNTGSLTIGKSFDPLAYLQGDVLYSSTEMKGQDRFTNFHVGGYGRLSNALGIENLRLTSRIKWDNRSDGPFRIHPDGDEFNFNLQGRWIASDYLRFKAVWDYDRSQIVRPDEVAILEFHSDPFKTKLDTGELLKSTITTNRLNLGGEWNLSEQLYASVDFNWINRDGIPNTDFGKSASPLIWGSEFKSMYALRYRPGQDGWNSGNGEWELKFQNSDRSNNLRENSAENSRLSLDWNGQIQDDLWAYATAGTFKTDTIHPELRVFKQSGKDLGFGLSYDIDESWKAFGDFMTWDVNGNSGYQENTYKAGLNYDYSKLWGFGLEYNHITGTFDAPFDNLDFTTNLLIIRITRRW